MKILIALPNDALRRFLIESLQSEGHEVLGASDMEIMRIILNENKVIHWIITPWKINTKRIQTKIMISEEGESEEKILQRFRKILETKQ